MVRHDRRALTGVPGVISLNGEGPPPDFSDNFDQGRGFDDATERFVERTRTGTNL